MAKIKREKIQATGRKISQEDKKNAALVIIIVSFAKIILNVVIFLNSGLRVYSS